MNTEDSEFKRLEHEALLRASQPEHHPQHSHTLQERLAELHLYQEINEHYAKCNAGAENLRDWVAERMDIESIQLALPDIEQYSLQMAVVSAAAFGYWKRGNAIRPDYYSAALNDVADLYQKYDALYQKHVAQPVQPEAWPHEDMAYRPGGLTPPEQEPVDKNGSPCPEFWDWLPKTYNFDGNGAFTKYNMEVAFLAGKQASQPEQEPVALQYPQKNIDWQREQQIKAQASSPPQRPWVGLTEEEQIQVAFACGCMSADWLDFAQAIEFKLKGKNA